MTERMFRDEECLPQYFNDEPVTKKKVVVPEGMLEAACAANHGGSGPLVNVLEASLLWLSKNPIVPSNEWMDEQIMSAHPTLTSSTFTTRCIAEWQRRMFLAPEPEVPEDIKDLWWSSPTPETKKRIIEAFRRGKKAGTK